MSHFSFTRSSYDRCALEKKDEESSAPFKWMTDVNVSESKDVCFESTSPFMQNPFKSIPSSVVDIESDLKGHKFDISKCPTHKYNPEQSEKIDFKLNECKENRLVPEYTRTKRPCNILSGVYIDRFQPFNEDYKKVFDGITAAQNKFIEERYPTSIFYLFLALRYQKVDSIFQILNQQK